MNAILQAMKSRTVILASIQAIIGIVILILTEADMGGYALLVKSLVDVVLRYQTTEPVSAK